MEMMSVSEMIGTWLFTLMVFYVNPLNDASRPDSKMNPYHEENILVERVQQMITAEGELVLEWWPAIVPYVDATTTTLVCFAIHLVSRNWLLPYLSDIAGRVMA